MKQTMQRRGVLTVAILMMFVLVFAGMFIASMTGSNKSASAADYEYNEGDGAVLNGDGSLTITFEVTESTQGETIAWVVYLIDSAKFTSYGYQNSHKFNGSEALARRNADYYFVSDNNTQEGYFSFTIPSNAPAYTHPANGDPVTENDYQNDDTGKTLIEVIAEKSWEIGVGPFWRSGWSNTGLAFNIDYYAGNSNAVVAASTYIADAFTFRDYNGTVLAEASDTIVAPSSPTRPGYTFDGWFCDTTKKTYTADQLSALTRNDVCVDGKSTATFYATYKKTGDVSDYLEFTTSVVSVNTDMVDNDGNVGRPYASADNMDFVSVRYDITRNPGIHNLVVLLDYNHDVFTLNYEGNDKITFPETPTALGEPTVKGGNEPNKILWEHNLSNNSTAPAYADTKESFFIVKFKINQEKVKSGMDYTFGLVIYPYIAEESGSTVANRIETVNDQVGEQVDVPVTLVVKTFTPVVREHATITIGGNIDNDPRYYERLYGSQFTTEIVTTLPTAYDEEYVDSEDAYTVHYTYDGDGVVVVTWYEKVDNEYEPMQSAPQMPGFYKVGISAQETLNYYAVDAVYCEVIIQKLVRSITIGNPGHIYSNDPEALYSSEDTSGITFSAYIKTQGEDPAAVTLDSYTDVGTYDIYYDLSYNEDIYAVTLNESPVEEGNGIKSNHTYTVSPRSVAFTVLAQEHTYGDTPEALAYTGAEDGITLTLSIAENSNAVPLNSTTPVNTYDILYTLSAASNYKLSNYAISVNNVPAGASGDTEVDYIVSPKVIYLKAADQIHIYTGEEVTTPFTGEGYFGFYTDEECTNANAYSTSNFIDFDPANVSITFTHDGYEHYIDLGTYAEQILATYSDPNHTITPVKGDLLIRGTQADYYYQFFEVFNETYTGQSQTMIRNKTALPEWVTSVAYKANSDAYGATIETPYDADPAVTAADAKTNAGTYVYTILITFESATDFDGVHTSVEIQSQNEEGKNLTASIAKATITLGAIGGSHTYGENPTMNYAAPTRGTEYTSSVEPFGDLVVATSINTTLTSTTNAGPYTVTVSATSEGDNFTITYDPETAPYTVEKATPSIELYAVGPFYYNRALNVTAEVTPNVGDATITYYSDNECQNALSGEPVNAGTYYAKASVIETTNYNSCESEVRQIIINTVRLSDVDSDSLHYSGGTVTWGSVTTDSGHMDTEPGVDPKALIDPTQVTYYVYSYDMETGVTTKVKTILPGAERTFTAQAETFYYITADVTSNANYTESSNTEAGFTYAVTFDCDHTTHTDYEVTSHSNLPNTMYVFEGESITLPALQALTNEYSFKQWKLGNATYNANASYEVNESVAFNAIWSKNAYKVYLKYFNTLTAYELNLEHGDDITYSPSALALLNTFAGYEGVNATDYRVAGWKYNNAVYTISNFDSEEINLGITATEDGMVFDAVLEFAIDYYMLEGTAAGAEAYENVEPVTEFVEYNTTIAYRAINQTYTWFKTDCWYTDANRTLKNAPATMSASRVSVYGAYKFDIGYGDVDGNGNVDTDDITLYRKWIVGGYPMTVVEVGNEWATVTAQNFEYTEGAFFLKRVADINADNSKDVRDVTITRMAFVGGYDWDIESGIRVTGKSIERTKTSYDIAALQSALSYGRARIYNNINASTEDVSVEADGDIYLDLKGNKAEGGYTLTVKSLTLITNGYDATITITNGTIVSLGTINIIAPNGNVVINNVDAYVNGDEKINLQAASSSLHFVNNVNFYDYSGNNSFAIDADGEIVENDNNKGETVINVAEGTHVVVEANAEITVAAIKVAVVEIVNNVPTFTPDNTKAITLTNNTVAAIEDLVTVGHVTEANALTGEGTEESPYLINNLADLKLLRDDVNAGNDYAGKFIKLMNNITLDDGWTPIGEGTRSVTKNISVTAQGNFFCGTFDGNNKTISGLNNTGYVPTAYAEDEDDNNYVYGLFGLVYNATIKNLTLTNVNIDTLTDVQLANEESAHGDSVAALVGFAGGSLSVDNVTVSGIVKAADSVAGILGRLYASLGGNAVVTITNCTNNAAIYTGTVGSAKAAGIAGFIANKEYSVNVTLSDNTNTGVITSTNFGAGIVTFGKNSSSSYASTTIALNITGNANSGNVSGRAKDGRLHVAYVAVCASMPATSVKAVDNTNTAEAVANAVIVDNYNNAQEFNEDGTAAHPYLIGTLAELKAFRDDVNGGNTYAGKYVKLTADITLDNGWAPIGEGTRSVTKNISVTAQGNFFCGTFDGNNKTISGLNNTGYVPTAYAEDEDDNNYVYGLFGLVYNATIKNLTLTNVNIDTLTDVQLANEESAHGDSVAALVGFAGGSLSVDNVTVSGIVKAADSVAGILGRLYASLGGNAVVTITNCTNNAAIYTGTVGSAKAAGIAGFIANKEYSVNVTLSDNTNTGVITSTNFGAGIVTFGKNSSSSYASTTIALNITGNANSGNVSGRAKDGRLHVAYVAVCASMPATSVKAVDNTNTAEAVANAVIVDNYNNAQEFNEDGTAAHPYLIGTLAELKAFRDDVNGGNTYAGKYVKLTADITLDNGWAPIGEGARKIAAAYVNVFENYTGNAFAGNFDGNNKTISNLNNTGFTPSNDRMDGDGCYAYGLFAITDSGANIHDLTLTGVAINIATGDSVGALVGFSAGSLTINNVTVSGSISGEDAIGGIVGRAYDQNAGNANEVFSVTNCVNNASISSSSAKSSNKAAGIVGFIGEYPNHNSTNTNTIANCTNNGTIAGGWIAGIAFYSYEANNTTMNSSLQNYVFSENVNNYAGVVDKYIAANQNVKNDNETFTID